MKNDALKVIWLYPDLMSIYGDRGNIMSIQKRCEWRKISVEIIPHFVDSSVSVLEKADMLFMGGAQDRQQSIVATDLQKKKGVIKTLIEKNVPGLFICGGFQYLGKYYKEADGTKIEQLDVLDVYTENPGGERLIGNIAIDASSFFGQKQILVGFENHGGRTKLGKDIVPLGSVLKGFGSNAEDHTEGAVYKNIIGTYLHGPILPKNPMLTDWLIAKALERKNNKKLSLSILDDSLETLSRESMLKRLR